MVEEKGKGNEKTFNAVSYFDEIHSWQLDEPKLTEKTESFNKVMNDWYIAMSIVRITLI